MSETKTPTMIPSEHEKREWRRMAVDAYDKDRNDVGHRFSAFGALLRDQPISLELFDLLQGEYRSWLIGGFAVPVRQP